MSNPRDDFEVKANQGIRLLEDPAFSGAFNFERDKIISDIEAFEVTGTDENARKCTALVLELQALIRVKSNLVTKIKQHDVRQQRKG